MRRSLIFILIFLIVATSLPTQTFAADTANTTVEIKDITGNVGDIVNAEIIVTNPSGVTGFQMDIKYDSSKIEPILIPDTNDPSKKMLDVTKSSMLSILTSNYFEGQGIIKLFALSSAVNSDTTLCKIKFRLKAAPSTSLEIRNLKLVNSDAATINATVKNGIVTIAQPQVPAPNVTPLGGVFNTPQSVTITGSGQLFISMIKSHEAVLANLEEPITAYVVGTPLDVALGERVILKTQASQFAVKSAIVAYEYEVLKSPEATLPSGQYSDSQYVGLVTPNKETIIYYTLDSSDPRIDSTARKIYNGKILINKNTNLKSTGYKGKTYSAISEYNYIINLGSINGKVTYNQKPLEAMTVSLKKSGVVVKTTKTDVNGSYNFTALAEGIDYTVITGGINGFGEKQINNISLNGGISTGNDFTLLRGATVKGIVKDSGNLPLSGVEVYVSNNSSFGSAYTDNEGKFWIEGLTAGSYALYTKNYLGMDDKTITQVELIADSIKDMQTITLTKPIVTSISGIAKEGATAIKDLYVQVYNYSNGSWGQATTAADGSYTINNLKPGNNYELYYYKWNGNDNLYGTIPSLTLNESPNTLNINIPLGIKLSGIITDSTEAKNPLSGIQIWASGQNYYTSTMTDANGHYEMKRFPAGTYKIEVNGSSMFYVDTRTTDQKIVTLVDGTDKTDYNIEMLAGGTMSGIITTTPRGDEKAIRVTAYSPSTNTCVSATTSADGSFVIKGLKDANDYELSAYKWGLLYASKSRIIVKAPTVTSGQNLILYHQDYKSAYFGGDGNRFFTLNPTIAPGKVITFRLDYKNNNTIATVDAIAEFTLPADIKLVASSVTKDGKEVAYVEDNNKITVNIGSLPRGGSGSISFKGELSKNTTALVLRSDAKITMPTLADENMGSALINVVKVDINAPSFAKPGKITVYGNCADGAEITVYGRKIGDASDIALAKAAAEGKWWTTNIELGMEGKYILYAVAKLGTEISDPSKVLTVEIKDNTAVLTEAIINAGWNKNVKANAKIGIPAIAVSQGYTVTIDAKFSNDVDTTESKPRIIFGLLDETLDINNAKLSDFKQNVTMAGSKDTFSGSFAIDYETSGDVKAYIRYKTDGQWQTVPVVQIQILIDPSGIVKDAHTNEPIKGVKAECQFLDTDNTWKRWPAENFGQVNSQYTDDEGKYGWDVPAGKYRVLFSKDGEYEAYTSEVVEVPPPKTDLNPKLVSLLSLEKPSIRFRTPEADTTGNSVDADITVEFTKDMDGQTLTSESFKLYKGVAEVAASIEKLNEKTYKLNPTAQLEYDTVYRVVLTSDIEDAYQKPIDNTEWSFTTMMNDAVLINVSAQLDKYARSTQTRLTTITISGKVIDNYNLANTLNIEITQNGDTINSELANVPIAMDGSFSTVFAPNSEYLGVYSIKAIYEEQSYESERVFEIMDVKRPTVEPGEGTFLGSTSIILKTTTNGAKIYYTFDQGEPNIEYTGPINLTESCEIKAIAVLDNVASEIGTFSYTIMMPTKAPIINRVIRAGDTYIKGTSENGATITVKRGQETVAQGKATASGSFSIPVNEGVTLQDDEELTITAIAANKTISEGVTVKVRNMDECFIATAAYGSKFQPSVTLLRQFRDQWLMNSNVGRTFVKFYYDNSPPIAAFIANNEMLKAVVRVALIPFVAGAYILLHGKLIYLILSLLLAFAMVYRAKLRKASRI